MTLICPQCGTVLLNQTGVGASIIIDGRNNDVEMMKKTMKCIDCGIAPVTEEEYHRSAFTPNGEE